MELPDPVTTLPGVGEYYANRLKKLGISTLSDLLNHFPFRYEDKTQLTNIADLAPDREATLKATIVSCHSLRTKTRLTLQKAILSDNTGQIEATWFNQPFLQNLLRPNQSFFFSGAVVQFGRRITLNSPDWEKTDHPPLHLARIVPIHNSTHGISQKWLRQKIHLALQGLTFQEVLSPPTGLVSLDFAYRQIHFPDTLATQYQAQRRLAFEDLFVIHLKSALTKHSWQNRNSLPLKPNWQLHQQFLETLPFTLTQDQQTALDAIYADLSQKKPMNRLLQGDVGSGKTVVAAAAALQVLKLGHHVILMAPTQVLASQHHAVLTQFLKPFEITPFLLTSQTSKKTRLTVPDQPFLVGTHALLHHQDLAKLDFGLLIVDEQHRFGVLQRTHFLNSHLTPHLLSMSATPIPRTIALSLFGHLDISDIKTLPTGRRPVKTWVVPDSKRTSAYTWIKDQLKQKNQAFVVCPFIDTSTTETLKNVKAATQEFAALQTVFKGFRLKLLHGRLKADEKDTILKQFQEGQFDLLVTTPVIEVGVDIPGASIMVIEGADRFGLAQLHQLRGRVGRRSQEAYCLLFASDEESSTRLKLLETHHQGLDIARLDLKMRGSGQLFGTSQSGHLDTQFDLFWDKDLNQLAQKTADNLATRSISKAVTILEKLNPDLANFVVNN